MIRLSGLDTNDLRSSRMPAQEEEFDMHKPVMINEVLEMLALRQGQIIVDATIGMGGHSRAIAEKIAPAGRLIGIDKDSESLVEAQAVLKEFSAQCSFVQNDFRHIDKVVQEHGYKEVDGLLLDLGISSFQLDNPLRGFSIRSEGPLDMRMDRHAFLSAYDLLNNLTEEEISSILWRFGQERFSNRIAHSVVQARQKSPISSTRELAEIVIRNTPYKARFQRIHPATRTFQALRIAVNRELDALDQALKKSGDLLKRGGRCCVISFHSLEDKIVKDNFIALVRSGSFRLVNKKVIRPSQNEIKDNPRSRSAKMRVIERLA